MILPFRPPLVDGHKFFPFHHYRGVQARSLDLGVDPFDELGLRVGWRHVDRKDIIVFDAVNEFLDRLAGIPIPATPFVLLVHFRRRLLSVARRERGNELPQIIVRSEFPDFDDVGVSTEHLQYRLVESVITCSLHIMLRCVHHDGRLEDGFGIALCGRVEGPVGLAMKYQIGEVDLWCLSCECINICRVHHALISMISGLE